jgi:hypothetical protein
MNEDKDILAERERVQPNRSKPCYELRYCPYGSLVELFELHPGPPTQCGIFGHRCPVFIVAEDVTE